MTKQKIVLQLSMFDEKSRAKALKTVAIATGVNSLALDGGDKSKLVVIGEDMDTFGLVKSLRKSFRTAELVSLEEVKEKKEEEKKKEDPKPVEPLPLVYHPCFPQHIVQTVPAYDHSDPCSIM